MNIAPKTIYAASSAALCVRSFVRSSIVALVLPAVLSGAVGGALAAPGDQGYQQRRDDGGRDNQQAEPRRQEQRQEPRQTDPRSFEARSDDQRRALQMPEQNHGDLSRRGGRLTPDERRDLRRQINEAGQDIYANPPRR